MTYILIILWFGTSGSYSGKASLAVEFHGLKACQAAEAAVKRNQSQYAQVLTECVAKGSGL